MRSRPSFWAKGSNRAIVYGFGLLILFGSYVIEPPDSNLGRHKVAKKTKLSATIKDSSLETIEPTFEQDERVPEQQVTPKSVTINPSKNISKLNSAPQEDNYNAPEYTVDEICDELAGMDAPPGKYINMFIGAVDNSQNIKTKEFISFPIATETSLAKIFANVQKPEGLEQNWQAYKLCNTSACVSGTTRVARGDWAFVSSLDKQLVTSGEVYALVYPTAKLPKVDCITRSE